MLGYTNFHTEGKYFFIPQQKSLLKNAYFPAIRLSKQIIQQANLPAKVIYKAAIVWSGAAQFILR